MTTPDDELLLALLNSAPAHGPDALADALAGKEWLAAHGQRASTAEWRTLVRARTALRDVLRGDAPTRLLAPFLDGVSQRAVLTDDRVEWVLDTPRDGEAAARAVLAWAALRESAPGRLRPCANPECRLFLVDRSKSNNARWCSMTTCGNRMKARRHYERTRGH